MNSSSYPHSAFVQLSLHFSSHNFDVLVPEFYF